MKVAIKYTEKRDCRYCEGSGKLNCGAPEPYDHYEEDCHFCETTGKEEVELKKCEGCGEYYPDDSDYFECDMETGEMYKCWRMCEESKLNK